MKQIKNLFGMTLFFLFIGHSYNARADLPKNYKNLSAKDKQSLIWEKVSQKPYETLPKLTAQLFLQALGSPNLLNLKPTLDHNSDEIPFGRIKFIHTYGSCALVEWKPVENTYTGMFQSGGLGIVRMGWAAPPQLVGYIPGMAVKLFIDKSSSVNLQLMNSLDGQGENANYFSEIFSNKIAEPKKFIIRVLGNIFKLATKNPFYLPVDHLARINSQGLLTKETNFPEVLSFKPRHSNWIPSNSKTDLRDTLLYIEPSEVLYDIYDDKSALIATLEMKTRFVNSAYCDRKLFFRHNSIEEFEKNN
ncbi:MAG: hypothetical protein V4596_01755 [Bdellovibrionota bacterium]